MYVVGQTPYATGLTVAALLSCTAPVTAADFDARVATPKVEVAAAGQEAVARVNGVAISALDLKRAVKVLSSGQRGLPPSADRQKELDKRTLTQLVSAELLYQNGLKLEIKDLDKQVAE